MRTKMELPCCCWMFELHPSNDSPRTILCHAPVCPFCNNPKLNHELALKHICWYLKGTHTHSLFFKPNLSDGFKCFVNADQAGNWVKQCPNDKTGALLRTGYLITYANCPIIWGSKMQMLVALSTTEAELIALSSAVWEVIHLQNMGIQNFHSFYQTTNQMPNL